MSKNDFSNILQTPYKSSSEARPTPAIDKLLRAQQESLKSDEKIIAALILEDENGELGEISSGLTQDFERNTNSFNVRHKDGSEYCVTVQISEI